MMQCVFRRGCEVFGDVGSPVIPLMLYNPTKIAAFSRECYKRGLVRRVNIVKIVKISGIAFVFS